MVVSLEIQAQTDGNEGSRFGRHNLRLKYLKPICAAAALQMINWRDISARMPLELPSSCLTEPFCNEVSCCLQLHEVSYSCMRSTAA
jgi:hypothetical protein